MVRLSTWDSGKKSFDYRFIDREISEFFGCSGTAVYCHLYLGPHTQDTSLLNRDGTTVPPYDPNNSSSAKTGNVSSIQDVLFLENRDRAYSDVVYELRGVYNLNDLDFNLTQFGLFLQSDTLFIEFHLNDMIAQCGRKLMPGDVLELPHRRDDSGLDPNSPAINKFYVIEDAARAAAGYSATWWPHVWRTKCVPMPAAQEYQDILNQKLTDPLGFKKDKTLGDIMSTLDTEMAIDEAVVDAAKANVTRRYLETMQFWMVVPEGESADFPWVFAGDGIPPNGAVLLDAGHRFPEVPNEGDYYLRTDYHPWTLFMYHKGGWRIQEQDFRVDWSAAHRLMASFINDTKTSVFPDYSAPERTNLSQALKPRADF